jgi:hypothetical protein
VQVDLRHPDRSRADVVPLELATQTWTIADGLVSLVAGGPLPSSTLADGVPLLTALFVHEGDEPGRCRRSVGDGWRLPTPRRDPATGA